MAASVLQGVSQIMAGRATARGYANEAAQADIQAKGSDLQATQSSERRREDRRAAIAALEADRAAKGLSLDSPTAVAIEREMARQSIRDEGVERLGFMNQSDALRRSARLKRKGASNSIMASYVQAAGTVWEGAQNAAAAAATGGTAGAANVKTK